MTIAETNPEDLEFIRYAHSIGEDERLEAFAHRNAKAMFEHMLSMARGGEPFRPHYFLPEHPLHAREVELLEDWVARYSAELPELAKLKIEKSPVNEYDDSGSWLNVNFRNGRELALNYAKSFADIGAAAVAII